MSSLWERFQQFYLRDDALGFSVDSSRIRFGEECFPKMEPLAQKAFAAMRDLEAGGIANPDENRMVGHYWLRAPQLAPTPELRVGIENCNNAIFDFVQGIHKSGKFTDVLLIGLGSALGEDPEAVFHALSHLAANLSGLKPVYATGPSTDTFALN